MDFTTYNPDPRDRMLRATGAALWRGLVVAAFVGFLIFALSACGVLGPSTSARDVGAARYVTVEINGTPVGSGVIYDGTHVITNAHVGDAVFSIKENAPFPVRIEVRHKGVLLPVTGMVSTHGDPTEGDLALLSVDMTGVYDMPALNIRKAPVEVGEDLFITTALFTMPYETLFLKATLAREALMQVLVWPGMSGSPVFDADGNLSGLVASMYFGTWSSFGERHNAGIAGIVTAAQLQAFIAKHVPAPVEDFAV